MNVNRLSTELIERELGTWLRDESETRAPVGLVEGVFARTSRTAQARRWWPPTPAAVSAAVRGTLRRPAPGPRPLDLPRRRPSWQPVPALAGLVAVAIIGVVLAIGTGRPGTGPGTSTPPGSAPSTTPGASPSPSPTTSAPAPASPSPVPAATPVPTTLGTSAAQRLVLGADAGPIDVREAFGSIWVANIHANDVRRYDPDTMKEVARIPVGSAAWFGVTDDAIWVTSQNGTGISRIDPATNTVVAHVGDVPPCAAPVLAFGKLWQAACDGGVILKIDPVTNALLASYPIQGHRFVVLAGGRLITVGSEGLASVDPDTGAFTPIGGGRAASEAELLVSDGTSVWVVNSAGIARLDPKDGHAIASFAYTGAHGVSFSGDHAWLTVTNLGALEIDLATNQVRRTIPVIGAGQLPFEAAGALWITEFDASILWRIQL